MAVIVLPLCFTPFIHDGLKSLEFKIKPMNKLTDTLTHGDARTVLKEESWEEKDLRGKNSRRRGSLRGKTERAARIVRVWMEKVRLGLGDLQKQGHLQREERAKEVFKNVDMKRRSKKGEWKDEQGVGENGHDLTHSG